jgi:hypothetical protein
MRIRVPFGVASDHPQGPWRSSPKRVEGKHVKPLHTFYILYEFYPFVVMPSTTSIQCGLTIQPQFQLILRFPHWREASAMVIRKPNFTSVASLRGGLSSMKCPTGVSMLARVRENRRRRLIGLAQKRQSLHT